MKAVSIVVRLKDLQYIIKDMKDAIKGQERIFNLGGNQFLQVIK